MNSANFQDPRLKYKNLLHLYTLIKKYHKQKVFFFITPFKITLKRNGRNRSIRSSDGLKCQHSDPSCNSAFDCSHLKECLFLPIVEHYLLSVGEGGSRTTCQSLSELPSYGSQKQSWVFISSFIQQESLSCLQIENACFSVWSEAVCALWHTCFSFPDLKA